MRARRTIRDVDIRAASPQEIFDLCFSLQAFCWSFVFAAKVWEGQWQGDRGRTVAAWAWDVAHDLLSGIQAIGRELDSRAGACEAGVREGGLRSWACRVAPAAQGGFASSSRTTKPACQKSPCWPLDIHSSTGNYAEVAATRGTLKRSAHTQQDGGRIAAPVLPQIVDLPRGMMVVLKPVNWEVDGLTSEGGGGLLLSSFVQSVLPRDQFPLVHTMELDFGFIHRLDVPSSGLVLGGTSLEGLFQLKWQLAVYSIQRQYVTVNHGHLGVSQVSVDFRIDATGAESLRSVISDAGRPACTSLSLVAHLGLGGFNVHVGGAAPAGGRHCTDLSLLAISIHTGRRHQIRAHTRHVGHPVATDARYTPRDVTIAK